MRYAALACDYDGTLAWEGTVAFNTLQALKRVKASGRRLILVTGRQLDDLIGIFPSYPVFDLIVAENGALLFWPATGKLRELAEPPPDDFLDRLQKNKVDFVTGRVVVATWRQHEAAVMEAIDESGLPLEMSFNKGAVMVLPRGCDKATGLTAAARELQIPMDKIVAVGDAENDGTLLKSAGFGVAVANALPPLRAAANWVTPSEAGEGVIQLVERLLKTELSEH